MWWQWFLSNSQGEHKNRKLLFTEYVRTWALVPESWRPFMMMQTLPTHVDFPNYLHRPQPWQSKLHQPATAFTIVSVKREDEESSSEIMQLQAGASPIRNPLKRKGANAAQSSDLCTTVRLYIRHPSSTSSTKPRSLTINMIYRSTKLARCTYETASQA